MKTNLASCFLIFGLIQTLYGQSSIRIFSGINLTNVNYNLKLNSTSIDSGGLEGKTYVLPFIGADMEFLLNKKFKLSTGLGVSWMGCKDYNKDIPSGINLEPNLRLGYIRIPCLINFEIIKELYLIIGYSFNYNFRKNQNLFVQDDFGNRVNGFRIIHHAVILGLRRNFGDFSLMVNYHKGMTRIFDSKNINSEGRAYESLGGMQISVGYTINE